MGILLSCSSCRHFHGLVLSQGSLGEAFDKLQLSLALDHSASHSSPWIIPFSSSSTSRRPKCLLVDYPQSCLSIDPSRLHFHIHTRWSSPDLNNHWRDMPWPIVSCIFLWNRPNRWNHPGNPLKLGGMDHRLRYQGHRTRCFCLAVQLKWEIWLWIAWPYLWKAFSKIVCSWNWLLASNG